MSQKLYRVAFTVTVHDKQGDAFCYRGEKRVSQFERVLFMQPGDTLNIEEHLVMNESGELQGAPVTGFFADTEV